MSADLADRAVELAAAQATRDEIVGALAYEFDLTREQAERAVDTALDRLDLARQAGQAILREHLMDIATGEGRDSAKVAMALAYQHLGWVQKSVAEAIAAEAEKARRSAESRYFRSSLRVVGSG